MTPIDAILFASIFMAGSVASLSAPSLLDILYWRRAERSEASTAPGFQQRRRIKKQRLQSSLCLDCGWPINPYGISVVCWQTRGPQARPPCKRAYDSIRHPEAPDLESQLPPVPPRLSQARMSPEAPEPQGRQWQCPECTCFIAYAGAAPEHIHFWATKVRDHVLSHTTLPPPTFVDFPANTPPPHQAAAAPSDRDLLRCASERLWSSLETMGPPDGGPGSLWRENTRKVAESIDRRLRR